MPDYTAQHPRRQSCSFILAAVRTWNLPFSICSFLSTSSTLPMYVKRKLLMLWMISEFHGSSTQMFILFLGNDTVSMLDFLPTFQRFLLSPSSVLFFRSRSFPLFLFFLLTSWPSYSFHPGSSPCQTVDSFTYKKQIGCLCILQQVIARRSKDWLTVSCKYRQGQLTSGQVTDYAAVMALATEDNASCASLSLNWQETCM
jgi:hypothetical protein